MNQRALLACRARPGSSRAAACFLSVAAALLSLSMSSEAAGLVPQRETHPQLRYLDRPEGVAIHELEVSLDVTASEEHQIARRFSTATRIATIGTKPDDVIEMVFGEVGDVVATSDGRVFVLDTRLDNVRVFGTDGAFRGTVGRPGPGPGEIAGPLSTAFDESRQLLYVGDRRRELDVFAVEGERVEFARSLRTPGADAESMCVLGDELAVVDDVASPGGGIAHVYSADAEELRAFGKVYDSPLSIVNITMSGTLVTCDKDGAYLIVAAPDVGDVKRYDADGRLVWVASAASQFIESAYIFESSGAVGMERPEEAFQLKTLHQVSPGQLLVQIGQYRVAEYGFDTVAIHSFAIDVETGAPTPLGTKVPYVAAIARDYFVTLHGQEADPWLAIHQFEGGDQ